MPRLAGLPLFLPIILALLFTRLVPPFLPEMKRTSAPRYQHYRDRPRGCTATVHSHDGASANPSMHQNHRAMEQGQPMLALDGLTVEAQAASEDDVVAAAASTGVGRIIPPPPPPLNAAPDLDWRPSSPPRPTTPSEQEQSASATAAATSTLLPLHNTGMAAPSASSPPPIQDGLASVVDSNGDEKMLYLEKVLKTLGYNEMASGAALLAKSLHWMPLLQRWNGPLTVFAAPDVFIQDLCSMCSRRFLLLEQTALGYYPFSELAAAPTMTIPSVFVGLYLNLTTEPGWHDSYYARLFVAGVEVSHPEVYNDGRYVVHGIDGIMQPFSYSSSGEARTRHGHNDEHRHYHRPVPSAATSTPMPSMTVRIRILESIARLRNRG